MSISGYFVDVNKMVEVLYVCFQFCDTEYRIQFFFCMVGVVAK